MARRTEIVRIEAQGRDQGKRFKLTEMAATDGEAWGMRALLALMRGGVDIPFDTMKDNPMAGIAVIGLQMLQGLPWDLLQPLLADMWACVQIVPDPADAEGKAARGLFEEDVQEIATRLYLRRRILELHIDFFTDATLWEQARGWVAAMQQRTASSDT